MSGDTVNGLGSVAALGAALAPLLPNGVACRVVDGVDASDTLRVARTGCKAALYLAYARDPENPGDVWLDGTLYDRDNDPCSYVTDGLWWDESDSVEDLARDIATMV